MLKDDTTDPTASLLTRPHTLPAGRWAIAVSGGADSVALLRQAVEARPVSDWHVVHLDHETRAGESGKDAEFVRRLSDGLRIASTIERISELDFDADMKNPSARFRAARLHLFRSVVRSKQLDGALEAHHADDQAETVLMRLLRGGPTVGIRRQTVIDGLTIVRPLLDVPSNQLRRYLTAIGQPWREDLSNQSIDYARNRARIWLKNRPGLSAALVRAGDAGAAVAGWISTVAPLLDETFRIERLADLPAVLAAESAKRWLLSRGSTEVDRASIGRLIAMAVDAATPNFANFPGNLRVRRQAGRIFAEKPAENSDYGR